MNAPTKFSVAASMTANRGDIARVATAVAIAFAVSWKPFVKSNASAVADDDHEDEVAAHQWATVPRTH